MRFLPWQAPSVPPLPAGSRSASTYPAGASSGRLPASSSAMPGVDRRLHRAHEFDHLRRTTALQLDHPAQIDARHAQRHDPRYAGGSRSRQLLHVDLFEVKSGEESPSRSCSTPSASPTPWPAGRHAASQRRPGEGPGPAETFRCVHLLDRVAGRLRRGDPPSRSAAAGWRDAAFRSGGGSWPRLPRRTLSRSRSSQPKRSPRRRGRGQARGLIASETPTARNRAIAGLALRQPFRATMVTIGARGRVARAQARSCASVSPRLLGAVSARPGSRTRAGRGW